MTEKTENPLIASALEKIGKLDAEARRLKLWINQADEMEGREPRFGADAVNTGVVDMMSGALQRGSEKRWKPGDFYADTFAGAVRRVLSARKEATGENTPASVDDIHAALVQGSFNFDIAGAENQKNSIRISLGKNSYAFVKLPNSDLFGLAEWYGAKGRKPSAKRAAEGADTNAGDDGVNQKPEEEKPNVLD